MVAYILFTLFYICSMKKFNVCKHSKRTEVHVAVFIKYFSQCKIIGKAADIVIKTGMLRTLNQLGCPRQLTFGEQKIYFNNLLPLNCFRLSKLWKIHEKS